GTGKHAKKEVKEARWAPGYATGRVCDFLELVVRARRHCGGGNAQNASDLFFSSCGINLDSILDNPYRLVVNIQCPRSSSDGKNVTNVTLPASGNVICGERIENVHSLSVPSFQFGDPCLKQYTRRHCFDDGFQVPKVVHYVWFSNRTLDIFTFLSVLSAYRFLNPCLVLFHADYLPFGSYWRALQGLVPVLVHVNRTAPAQIFGKPFGFVQHQSDIARIEALKEYGGIYLDGDQLVLRSLDDFRHKSFVMGHENNQNLANSLLLSAPDAKFIDVWYRSYKSYDPRQWGIHSTFLPLALSRVFRDMIHVAGYAFVKPDLSWIHEVWEGKYNWANNHAVHLYVRSMVESQRVRTAYTLDELKRKNSSLGEITRHIMFGAKDMCIERELGDADKKQ
ncbi:hypothetical protein BaRGS_00008223, partial [Batillaria attramentaria]